MHNQSASSKLSPEFWAIIAVGIAVLGQGVWLDAKIERVEARLEAETRSLKDGQAAIRERLALVEGHVGRALPDALVEGEAMPAR